MTHAPLSRAQKAFNLYARYVQKPALVAIRPQWLARKAVAMSSPLTYKAPKGLMIKPRALTSDGAQVKAATCTIRGQDVNGTLLYLHGGAFVIGSLTMYQHLVARLGQTAGLRGVFIDYRLAPEHPFPAAVDDAFTAYKALLADPDAGPIALCGDSAGGNLVFALLLRIKANGLPMPKAAVAFSPVTDLRGNNPSLTANAATDHLVAHSWAQRGIDAYLSGQSPETTEASPILGDFTGAPPVMIHYDETEVLADDSRLMIDHLRAQGVTVETEVKHGCVHVWHLNVGRSREADHSVTNAGDFLRKAVQTGYAYPVDSTRAPA